MSLFGVLKGVVGLGPGIEGCKRDAAAGKAEAQFALGGFYERGQMGLAQSYAESAKW
jgi:TPR repeat protein